MCADGAMGTYLQQKAGAVECVEALNLRAPELVLAAHREYLLAGARLLETNTFSASAPRLERCGMRGMAGEVNAAAVRLAREAAVDMPDVIVAGSVGPLSLQGVDFFSMRQDVAMDHFAGHAGVLFEAGADAVFLETLSSLDEALLALEASLTVARGKPVGVMLAPSEEGRLAGGVDLSGAFKKLADSGASVLGLNATLGPAAMLKILENLEPPEGVLLAAFPNAGKPQYLDGHFLFFATPEYFASKTAALVEHGVRLLGGCIGTTPEHIRALSAKLPREVSPPDLRARSQPPAKVSVSFADKYSAPPADASSGKQQSLIELVSQRVTTIVELDTPKTLPLEKYFSAARSLWKAGADFISLADNALAILRNSNMAVGSLLLQRGIRPLIHLACRDKNVIAMQSELMGLHSLGLNHILTITGDPAKVGDHPSATSVYDMNSIGLIRLAASFNIGISHAGRELKGRTDFVIGCSFNPNAKNLDNQFKKLESKLAAGAHFVITQPVFDVATVERCAGGLAAFGVPVFLGVMPIMNEKNAEFLHNEVPGISIPDEVREAFRGLDREAAREVSLRHCARVRDAILERFKGLYLITPLLRTDLIEPLIPAPAR